MYSQERKAEAQQYTSYSRLYWWQNEAVRGGHSGTRHVSTAGCVRACRRLTIMRVEQDHIVVWRIGLVEDIKNSRPPNFPAYRARSNQLCTVSVNFSDGYGTRAMDRSPPGKI